MKKIIAILLAVVLVVGGLGGFAYAQGNSHEPMTGQKLVGGAALGTATWPDGTEVVRCPDFAIANQDCVGEITVERLSIIRSDGTLIYEGPFLCTLDGIREKTEPMKPHEIWILQLALCIPDGEGGWLAKQEAISLPTALYTVEIFWTGHKQGCPLTGSVTQTIRRKDAYGNVTEVAVSRDMRNMVQKLKPTPPPPPEPALKIGSLAPITGPAADKGEPMYHGEQDYFRYINDMGGIRGHPINATFYDNEYNDEVARQRYREAVGDGALLITAMSSKVTAACYCLFNADRMPFIHAYSSPQCLHPPGHGYAALPAHAEDCAAFMNWLHDSGQTPCRLALYGLNNPTGWSARDAATALAESLGITVVGNWEHHAMVTYEGAKATLMEIQALNPDWLYVSSTPAPSATIVKAARDLAMTAGICLGHAGARPPFIYLAGEDAEGVYGMQGVVFWGTPVPGMAKAVEYCLRFHPEDEGNSNYLEGWHLGMCATEALKKAVERVPFKKLTPRNVERHGVRRVSFDAGGLTGWVDWTDKYDRRGAKSANLYVVQGGEWVVVEPWIEAPLIRYEDYPWFEPIICP